MNAWNAKVVKQDQAFRVTAGGAKCMKIAVVGGSGNYTLESSADGGTTWVSSGVVVAADAQGSHVTNPADASPILLSNIARVTGADAAAVIYVMQED